METINRQSTLIFATLIVFVLSIAGARSEELQIGLSNETIPVDSSFSGARLFVFGSIDKADDLALILDNYSIIVSVKGPGNDVVVRKKERILGIWVNRHQRTYSNVPEYYAVVSAKPLEETVPGELLKETQLGIGNLEYNLSSSGDATFILPEPDFSSALRRIRLENSLFTENSGQLDYLGKSLFRAAIDLPSNVPIGEHTVTTYMFKGEQLLDAKSASFFVRKVGFERWLFDMAHQNSFLYGLMAVLLAIITGWLANLAFKKD